MSETVHEWYDSKHPAVKKSEVQFLNSLPADHCPVCGARHIIKYGFYKDGTQCYRCFFLRQQVQHSYRDNLSGPEDPDF
ncbi:transposase-like zinc-binding domain-containing protein [Anaerolactibacter massiliensis]|uniref:transposase-like zinc-binding domain-containing protein n=1 Tax=Anaerolactibacter massiliensis TaxID=2044573 RepID=UPI003B830CC1